MAASATFYLAPDESVNRNISTVLHARYHEVRSCVYGPMVGVRSHRQYTSADPHSQLNTSNELVVFVGGYEAHSVSM